MIQLPNNKKCYNLPEQVAQNLLNIQYLAEQYKNIDELPAIWADYKTAFDADLHTFEDWTTTFEGWEHTLETYLANMSSAAVGAIAGQNIAPADVAATGNITGASIIENMSGYEAVHGSTAGFTITDVYTSACKNGNKITFVSFVKVNKSSSYAGTNSELITRFTIPTAVGGKLYPYSISGYSNMLEIKKALCVAGIANQVEQTQFTLKQNNETIDFMLEIDNLVADTDYLVRIEQTFLLSDGLI